MMKQPKRNLRIRENIHRIPKNNIVPYYSRGIRKPKFSILDKKALDNLEKVRILNADFKEPFFKFLFSLI